MANLETTHEDRGTIRDILLAMREGGVEHPILPADVDLDGDGLVDGFGLDAADNVVVVLGCPIQDTAYEATGEEG